MITLVLYTDTISGRSAYSKESMAKQLHIAPSTLNRYIASGAVEAKQIDVYDDIFIYTYLSDNGDTILYDVYRPLFNIVHIGLDLDILRTFEPIHSFSSYAGRIFVNKYDQFMRLNMDAPDCVKDWKRLIPMADFWNSGDINLIIEYSCYLRNTFHTCSISSAAFETRRKMAKKAYAYEPLDIAAAMRISSNKHFSGLNFYNEKYLSKELNNVYYLDINSAYSYVQKTCPMPGPLVKTQIIEKTITSISEVDTFAETTIFEAQVPSYTVKISDPFKLAKYNNVWIAYTQPDLKSLFLLYDNVSIHIHGMWLFQQTVGQYQPFIDHYYDVKQHYKFNPPKNKLEFFEQLSAKCMLNFSYGFDGAADRKPMKNTKTRTWLPYCVFTAAWQRLRLAKIISLLDDDFIYCDTDSILITENGYNRLMRSGLMKIDNDLGHWKIASIFNRFYLSGIKTYAGIDGAGRLKIIACGISQAILQQLVTFDEFKAGKVITPKLIQNYNRTHTDKIPDIYVAALIQGKVNIKTKSFTIGGDKNGKKNTKTQRLL